MSYRIPTVEKFNFTKPEEWSHWIRRFERFRQASDLVSKLEEVQVGMLVYSLGDKAEDILTLFNLEAEELKKYDTVKGKFESYFEKRRNTIYERPRFNSHTQRENESVEEFIADLYRLAKNCGYGTLHDELVRDRTVVGIRDSKLSKELQLEAELTLDSCITKVRQSESVKKQQDCVRGDQSDKITIEAVKSGNQRQTRRTTGLAPRPQKCSRCGKSPPHADSNTQLTKLHATGATRRDTSNAAAKQKGASSKVAIVTLPVIVKMNSWVQSTLTP